MGIIYTVAGTTAIALAGVVIAVAAKFLD